MHPDLLRLGGALCVSALLTGASTAQLYPTTDLENGDFENGPVWLPWSAPPGNWTDANFPRNWNFAEWQTGGGTNVRLEPVTSMSAGTSPDIYSGMRAAELVVTVAPPNGELRFGRTWTPTDPNQYPAGSLLEGSLRIRLSRAGLAAGSTLSACEVDASNPSTVYGTKSSTALAATTEWQEVQVAHTLAHTASSTAPLQVRFLLEISGATDGDRVLLDYAQFGGSSKAFNTLVNHSNGQLSSAPPQFPDQAVHSSALALAIDGESGRLLHLRPILNEPGPGERLGVDLINSNPNLGQPQNNELSDLFELELRDANYTASSLNSSDGAPSAIAQLASGVRIEHSYPAQGFDVHVTIEGTPASEELQMELELLHQGAPTTIVEGLTCPVLHMPLALGSELADDRYFISNSDGQLYDRSKITSWFPSTGFYPGSASMQLLAYYDQEAGFGMYAADGSVEAKKLFLGLEGAQSNTPSRMHIEHRVPYEPGAIASYPVVFVPCVGDWRDAAEDYRDWGLAQPWAQPLQDWLAPPAWLDERPTQVQANMRPERIGIATVDPTDSNGWSTVLNDWSVRLGGGPMAPLYRSYEQHGTYVTGPTMTPLRVLGTNYTQGSGYDTYANEAQLAAAWHQVGKAGHVNSVMFAAFKWAISRAQSPAHHVNPPVGPQCDNSGFAHWNYELGAGLNNWNGLTTQEAPAGIDVCVRSSGAPAPGATVFSPGATWDASNGRFCPWHPYTMQLHEQFARYVSDLGVDLFELDQWNDSLGFACYNSNHFHPMGAGRWMYESYTQALEAMLVQGRQTNPNFTLSKESPAEYYIRWVPAFFTRPHKFFPGHWGAPFGEVVPAFQFVYGSVAHSMTGDLNAMSAGARTYVAASKHALPALGHARAFVAGSIPWIGLPGWQLIRDAASPAAAGSFCGSTSIPAGAIEPTWDHTDAALRLLIANTVRTGQGPAKPFFNEGRMLRTEGFDSPPMSVDVHYTVNSQQVVHTAQTVQVEHSAWEHEPSGRWGVVFANANDNQSSVFVPPHTIHGTPIPAGHLVDLYIDGALLFADFPYGLLLQFLPLGPGQVAWFEMDAL